MLLTNSLNDYLLSMNKVQLLYIKSQVFLCQDTDGYFAILDNEKLEGCLSLEFVFLLDWMPNYCDYNKLAKKR